MRDGVRVLAEQDGAYRVLMVDGPRYSGRTYTLEYISYLSSRLESFKFYYTDLKEDYTPDYRPGDLLVSIAHRMGADPRSIPPQEAQSARWTRLLYDWLIEQAARSEQSWWIVVDGAGQVSLSTEMQDFLHRLVKEVDRTNPPVRIVLLDCGELCREWTDIADNILPAGTSLLTPVEVQRFFRSLAQLHGTDVADNGLEAMAEWVVQQASTPPPPALPGNAEARFMRQLATAVGLAYQQFFVGPAQPGMAPQTTEPSQPAAARRDAMSETPWTREAVLQQLRQAPAQMPVDEDLLYDAELSPLDWAYREAAAVLSFFTLGGLRPLGQPPSDDPDVVATLLASCRPAQEGDPAAWTLRGARCASARCAAWARRRRSRPRWPPTRSAPRAPSSRCSKRTSPAPRRRWRDRPWNSSRARCRSSTGWRTSSRICRRPTPCAWPRTGASCSSRSSTWPAAALQAAATS